MGGDSDLDLFLCQVECGGQIPSSPEIWVWFQLKVLLQLLLLFQTVLLITGA